jgi:hypothetical protein
VLDQQLGPLATLLARRRPGQVGRPGRPGERPVEHECAHALGVRDGELHDLRRAAGRAQQHRALAAGGVEDGPEVGDVLLRRRQVLEPVGHPDPAPVHEDQPAPVGEAVEEPGQARLLPQRLDVRERPRGQDDVDRTVAVDLEGDVRVAGARVAGRGRHGPRTLSALAAQLDDRAGGGAALLHDGHLGADLAAATGGAGAAGLLDAEAPAGLRAQLDRRLAALARGDDERALAERPRRESIAGACPWP